MNALPLVNPHRIDLNLVRVCVAIHESGSVTRAADLLSLTQPTVSYGLAKLRELFGDPIFLRSARAMVPTPRGEQICQQFREALTHIDSALESAQAFDPLRSTRQMRVAMSDIGGLVFLPPLFGHLQRHAPNLKLEIVEVPVDQVAGELAAGRIDAAVGNLPTVRARTRSTLLFAEHYVCMMSAHHALATQELTLNRFVTAKHVVVASPFSGHRLLDQALAEQGVAREVSVITPHFTILASLVSSGGVLATLPSRVARAFAGYAPLVIKELPVKMPEFEVRLHWNERQENAAAQRWLREQITQALGSLQP
ncbi:DNA-binding transcriptional regulator, LysR family [Polaromonas sp. OV174]|uniref:LysR family transcriptional regulator n=1 Tax=Polaromonas sp. OV174 TaxID=1855300 RepID=UPI0008F3D30C|nr:LysR family transcriptional regulator [Polaromonas sp. OV174]SFC64304.1 DNA-binding transcriptional regulator, LysR family [Polaromonas sp. OV174]